MTVVLFYIGVGMRIREYWEALPELVVPVRIGYQPIPWRVTMYHADYGRRFLGGVKQHLQCVSSREGKYFA